jgi:heptosyltransferase-3
VAAPDFTRILVLRGGAIGDFILTLPVLSALRRRYPGARLEILGYPRIASLAQAAGLAHQVRAVEDPALASFFTRGSELNPGWRDYFGGFDLVISYLADPGGCFLGNLRQCTRAVILTGPPRPDEAGSLHAIQVFQRPLAELGIEIGEPIPEPLLVLPPGPPLPPGPWLAAHPGSGGARKNWPEDCWRACLEGVAAQTDYRLLLVGGEAEAGRVERLARALPGGRVRLACHRPLPELGQMLRHCARFVGHDSGITHLAAAVGLPCLVLWGPSRLPIWRPPGRHVRILSAPEGLGRLAVETVLQQIITG